MIKNKVETGLFFVLMNLKKIVYTDDIQKAQIFTSESYEYFNNWNYGEIMVWLESERKILTVYTDETKEFDISSMSYTGKRTAVHYL